MIAHRPISPPSNPPPGIVAVIAMQPWPAPPAAFFIRPLKDGSRPAEVMTDRAPARLELALAI